MKGQAENPLDLGIGRKVEYETTPGPEWKAIPGKKHHYEHTSQKNADGTPLKRYAPPVPDCPQYPTTWEALHEALKKAGMEPDWAGFYPLELPIPDKDGDS